MLVFAKGDPRGKRQQTYLACEVFSNVMVILWFQLVKSEIYLNAHLMPLSKVTNAQHIYCLMK